MQQYYEPHLGYRLPAGTDMTPKLLGDILHDYRTGQLPRYEGLRDAYEGRHAILTKPPKDQYKPDNRLVANFQRQIVDTMVGYFLGVPIRLTGDGTPESDAAVSWLQDWGSLVGSDDVDAELSKTCDIYGSAYEVLWRDAGASPRTSVATPMGCLMVFDDTVARRPMYAARFFLDTNRFDGEADCLRGTLYTPTEEVPFEDRGGIRFGDPAPHGFPGVPVVEYVENEERRGLFEGVQSLVEAYEDALSEKANDVDYYADAYLSILGAKLDDQTLKHLRDSRIINLSGSDADKVLVQFLSKPEADGTQENLLGRLERLIYSLSMVADISDEDFGTASGIAIRYRLQAMSDLALVKERKFRRGLRERWRLLLGYAATTGVDAGAWLTVTPRFTRNLPANLVEEAQVAAQLSGIVSEETQLSVLSCVESTADEIARKASEAEEAASAAVFPREAAVADDDGGEVA